MQQRHHVGGMDALVQRLGAGGFDRGQPVGQHGAEDLHHLPVAVRRGAQLGSRTRSMAAGSTQCLNGAPLRRAPGLRASTGT